MKQVVDLYLWRGVSHWSDSPDKDRDEINKRKIFPNAGNLTHWWLSIFGQGKNNASMVPASKTMPGLCRQRAAMTAISTVYSGAANRASTQARPG